MDAGLIIAIVAMVIMAGIIGFALIFHIHKTARPLPPAGYVPPSETPAAWPPPSSPQPPPSPPQGGDLAG